MALRALAQPGMTSVDTPRLRMNPIVATRACHLVVAFTNSVHLDERVSFVHLPEIIAAASRL
jgi:hypothetical protein